MTEDGDRMRAEGWEGEARMDGIFGGAFSLLLDNSARGSMGLVVLLKSLGTSVERIDNDCGGRVGYTLVRFFLSDEIPCVGEMSTERLDVNGDTTFVSHVSIEFIFSSDLSGRGITSGTPWLEWQSEAMLDGEDCPTRGFAFVI